MAASVVALSMASAAQAADKGCHIGQMLELPVTMINRQPTVPVTLNGHSMRLVADSGAFFSTLSPGAAAEYGFKLYDAPYGLRLEGIGGEVEPRVTKVDDFKLGPLMLHRVEFLVGGSEIGTAGLLGQNILGVADVEYDLANGVVRLMKPDNCSHANLAYWAKDKPVSMERIEPAKFAGMHTQGTVILNGVKLRAIFDTGAGTSMLSRAAAARAGIKPDSPGVTDAGYSSGIGSHVAQTWIAPFESLAIGDETIKKIRLRFGDLNDNADYDMLIGADFFLSHRVYVSNALHAMFFTYNGGPVFDLSIHHDGDKAGAAPPLTTAVAYSGRGMAFAARHEFARGRDDLSQAIKLAPDDGRLYAERARIDLAMKDPKAAASDFDTAIKLMPNDADVRIGRAWLRFRQDDKAGARADADAANHLLAGPSDARFELAGLYDALDLPAQAIQQYGLWIDAHPHDSKLASAFNNRCWKRATSGTDLDGAVADCNKAVHLAPHEASYRDSRGLAYLRHGDTKKAIDDYDDALRIDPKLASSLYGRGVARRRLGQTSAGDADIAAAKAIDQDTVDELRKDGVTP
ncbi:MAG: aspartyl protease family protein [Sphingomonas sp.]